MELTFIALIVTAFVAFYVRRFGQGYILFPVLAWSFILMATVLPLPSTHWTMNILPAAFGSIG
ncbi:hypothetical protein ABTL76_19760, partial [Acinetobacter baumannii]